MAAAPSLAQRSAALERLQAVHGAFPPPAPLKAATNFGKAATPTQQKALTKYESKPAAKPRAPVVASILPAGQIGVKGPARPKLAPAKAQPKRAAQESGFGGLLTKVGRVALQAGEGVVKAVAHDPLGQAGKTVTGAADLAKGAAETALALPYQEAKTAAQDAAHTFLGIGHDHSKDMLHFAKHIVNNEADYLSNKYGPSWRNDPGAAKHIADIIAKEGPVPTAADAATVLGGVEAAIGRVGAQSLKAAGRSAERPALKTNSETAAVKQTERKGLVGQAITGSHDALRKGAQKTAELRAESTIPLVRKPLAGRRTSVAEGEVAPISSKAANRRLRLRTATLRNRELAKKNYETSRLVTSPHIKGSLAHTLRKLPEADRELALYAVPRGIRSSEGALNYVKLRERELAVNRTAAAVGKGASKSESRIEARAAAGKPVADEQAMLSRIRANPQMFDRPEIGAAADRIHGISEEVGKLSGLTAQERASGRTQALEGTLGTQTAKSLTAERQTARAGELSSAKAAQKEGNASAAGQLRQAGQAHVKAQTALKAATAEVRATQSALQSIGRSSTNHKPLPSVVATAQRRADAAVARLDAAKATADAARSGRDAARKVAQDTAAGHRARISEISQRSQAQITRTPLEQEKRIVADAAKQGLVAPGHVKSGFEKLEASVQPKYRRNANPNARTNRKALIRLGRGESKPKLEEANLVAQLRAAGEKRAEQSVLHDLGNAHPSENAALDHLRERGVDVTPDGLKAAGLSLKRAEGDRSGAVFVVPKAVEDELRRLGLKASAPAGLLRHLASFPQAALLAGSLSWFQFQRVNDIIASALGGSLHETVGLSKLQRELAAEDPSSREISKVFSGETIGAQHLQPDALREMGRWQGVLDGNKMYRKALASDNPATQLLLRHVVEQNPLTAALRADRAITGGFRERQFLHNLRTVAAKMDANASFIHRTYAPLGGAFKTGDIKLWQDLLNSPEHAAAREEAARRLIEIHGDWHNYTAREQALGPYAAFYGFLRYATRMALFTLPIGHPYMGALVAQLGEMGQRDARAVIGPKLPFGIGVLYNDDGTIAADLTRANPAASGLFNINKPEDVIQLATPIAGLLGNWVAAKPIALSDSTTGYDAQYSVNGDLKNHALGGLFSGARSRILASEALSLLSPYVDWKKWDGRVQTSDSLAFSRRFAQGASAGENAKIAARSGSTAGGLAQALHHNFPLLTPGLKTNYRLLEQQREAAQQKASDAAELRKAKIYGLNNTAGGTLQQRMYDLDQRLAAAEGGGGAADLAAREADLERRLKLAQARAGIP